MTEFTRIGESTTPSPLAQFLRRMHIDLVLLTAEFELDRLGDLRVGIGDGIGEETRE